jgi:MFS family permease
MISYRLLELHANSFVIGSFGALYALFPLLLAIPLGRWINQFGEGRFITLGTVLIAISTFALATAHNELIMVFVVVLLGTSQLLCMTGAQAIFANRTERTNYENYFGY